MIRGSCFTNIDDFGGVDWPRMFVAVPRLGERVEGVRDDKRPTLRVVGVTHYMRDGQPLVLVELHR